MAKHKRNPTARYTEDDVRRVVKSSLKLSVERAARSIHELHVMAFKDYITEHAPRIDHKRAIVDYCELIVKYSNDLEAGEFTDADVRRYNRDPEVNNQ